jgi:hypothetical protein
MVKETKGGDGNDPVGVAPTACVGQSRKAEEGRLRKVIIF